MSLDDFLGGLEAKAKGAKPGPWRKRVDLDNPFWIIEDCEGREVCEVPIRWDTGTYDYLEACDPKTIRFLVAVARAAEAECTLHRKTTVSGLALEAALAALEAHAGGAG